MIKPRAFKKGDKVAIVSLSSGMLGEEFCKFQLELGSRRLKEFGLEPVFMPNSLKGIEYLKNNPQARADDLKEAFYDDDIAGIICSIGGDDTFKTVPYLLDDENFIKKVKSSPKIFTGYSDSTINHLMFYKIGLTTYYGPNFIVNLAEHANEMLEYDKSTFERYMGIKSDADIVSSPTWYEERTDFSSKQLGIDRISHIETKGYELLQGRTKFSGRLLGGCIESLYDLVVGERYSEEPAINEKYALFPSKSEWQGKILFLETSENKPSPEKLEKMIHVFTKLRVFENLNGIIIGKPQDEMYYDEYKIIWKNMISKINPDLPIVFNINFGHAHPITSLPYGTLAEVDACEQRIRFKEKFVE